MAGFTFGIMFTASSAGGSATGAYFDFVAAIAAGISWVYLLNYIIYVTAALIKCTANDTLLVRIQAECKQRAARTDEEELKMEKMNIRQTCAQFNRRRRKKSVW